MFSGFRGEASWKERDCRGRLLGDRELLLLLLLLDRKLLGRVFELVRPLFFPRLLLELLLDNLSSLELL